MNRKIQVHADSSVAASVLKRAIRAWEEDFHDKYIKLITLDSPRSLARARMIVRGWEAEYRVRIYRRGNFNVVLAYWLYCGELKVYACSMYLDEQVTLGAPIMLCASEEDRLRLLGAFYVAEDYNAPTINPVEVLFSPIFCNVTRPYLISFDPDEARWMKYLYKSTITIT